MFSSLRFLIVLVLLGCAGAAYADPPGRVGRLNYASGAVSFASAEAQDEWGRAALNRPLTNGDRLWVERDGRAEFHVGSTAVRMGSYTAVDVLNLDDDRLQLRLAEGTLNVRVRDVDQNDVIEIATPAAAVLLREPGSYRVSVDSQQDTARVTVQFGSAEVVTPDRSFVVPSSQAVVIAAGAAPAFEVAAHSTPDDFDRWSAERDRREDRSASVKYVSRQMTGYEDLDDHGAWRNVADYGPVWVPARVQEGWAPYRYGHWKWISPWGWTWIDDAPWGFAPFHYGRWVWVNDYWAWAPGPIVRRPVYAPALVAFVGGAGFTIAASRGPAVGWFPLGWREPFVPWYRASSRHVHSVNVTHVKNVTNITNVTYVNRSRPEAVTVVSQQAFVSSRPAWQERHRVAREDLARAEVIRSRAPADPVRASFVSEQPGRRPPADLRSREVVALNPPASFTRRELDAREQRVLGTGQTDADGPRVRVLSRDRAEFSAPGAVTRSTEPGRTVDERSTRRFESRDAARDERREGAFAGSGDSARAPMQREPGPTAPQRRSPEQVRPDLEQRGQFGVQPGPGVTTGERERDRERRERRSQQEAAERAREAQRQGQPPVTPRSPPHAQAPQTPPPPPRSQAAQTQTPQIQPQPSRGQPPQARQPSNNDDARGGERRSPQRQTPRDRD